MNLASLCVNYRFNVYVKLTKCLPKVCWSLIRIT